MNKIFYALVVLMVTLIAGIILIILPGKTAAPTQGNHNQASTTPTFTNPYPDQIAVESLQPGQKISSGVTITGKARGWYFEASFPVELRDASGKVIAQAPAQAQGDWMTTEFVPYSVTLAFAPQPAGSTGTLVLKNDNPSGLPENDRSVSFPVTF